MANMQPSVVHASSFVNIIKKGIYYKFFSFFLPGVLWACTATSPPGRSCFVPKRWGRLLCGKPVRRASRRCCRTRPSPHSSTRNSIDVILFFHTRWPTVCRKKISYKTMEEKETQISPRLLSQQTNPRRGCKRNSCFFPLSDAALIGLD